MDQIELTSALKADLFQLLTEQLDDVARHYDDAEHFFRLSTIVWQSPSEFLFEAPEVDRAYLFQQRDGGWAGREVWLSESTESNAINESNGGTYLFDVESTLHREGPVRVFLAAADGSAAKPLDG